MASNHQFGSLNELCTALGGDNPIHKVLIANNGLAAVKGIVSIRNWLHEHINDADAIQMTVLASPEDMSVNAEFIRLSNQHFEVPGGSNANNYANVELIVGAAVQSQSEAVYPGWGHASENPALPRECKKTGSVTFLGPDEKAMFALGDKIASTIVAQSNGVPTVAWSGDAIRLPINTFHVPEDVYRQAHIASAEECELVCERIGFPLMIKASEGGGGKGIRKVTHIGEVATAYNAVAEEVKGSPIFCMRMLDNVRHLEVQLLADRFNNCIAVRTRDCSVQRRHQKIIEEGPVIGVDPEMVLAMEKAAIRLAKAVGYQGLGTVEYMYDKNEKSFCFLELNPRIQVEHPVSELISGVNLPAALLCVGMGIPLYRIPEVRTFYGELPYESTPIDFEKRLPLPPKNHAIAVRITAENVDEGFRPTTGTIDSISFSNSKECWGYFSVPSGGGIHQFADSQFGHIFATGATREEARRGMVFALRNTSVRGEIRTSHGYVVELLERQEFRECDVSTAWLDRLIANRSSNPGDIDIFPYLCAAAIHRMKAHVAKCISDYTTSLTCGHTPSTELLTNFKQETFVHRSEKFVVDVVRTGPAEYGLTLNDTMLVVPCRDCGSGLQMTLGGSTIVAYCEDEPTSLRITVGGQSITFTGDVDPTKLRSTVPGRLVRFLVADGGHVNENTAYAEVEVMKMILPLTSTVSGTVHLRATAGSALTVGKLLAEIEPDDPSRVARPSDRTDPWPQRLANVKAVSSTGFEGIDGITRVKSAVDTLWNLMQGYHPTESNLAAEIEVAQEGLTSMGLESVTIEKLAATRAFLAPYVGAKTSHEKTKAVIECLAEDFLVVEGPFDASSRESAIAKLREENEEDIQRVYRIDFAHNQPHRQTVLIALLNQVGKHRRLMVACKPLLERIGSLRKAGVYGGLLLIARYLLRQCALPSFEERKEELCHALENDNVENLLKGSYNFDLMCSVLFDARLQNLVQPTLMLWLRRAYFGAAAVDHVDLWLHNKSWFGRFSFKQHGPEFTGLYPLEGVGLLGLFADGSTLSKQFGLIIQEAGKQKSATTATVFYAARTETSQDAVAYQCAEVIGEHLEALKATSVEVVTFLVHGAQQNGPLIFTFRRSSNFNEDALYRNLIPTTAHRLELQRLKNYSLSMFATPNRQVHIFSGAPLKARSSAVETRLFVRMYVTPRDLGLAANATLTTEDAAHVLQSAIGATEFARADRKLSTTVFNHLFFNFIEVAFDVAGMHALFLKLKESFAAKLYSLGFREVEIKFKVLTTQGPVTFRVFIVNPTGHATAIRSYIETFNEEDRQIYLQRAEYQDDLDLPGMWESRDNLDAIPESPLFKNARLSAVKNMLPRRREGAAPATEAKQIRLEPYAHMSEKQVKRLNSQLMGTTYGPDWLLLLDVALRRQWRTLLKQRNLSFRIPSKLVDSVPLTLRDGKLVSGEPSPDCGVLAWAVEYLPPAYFDLESLKTLSRKIVLVANDITYNSGSFAVPEDELFAAASVYARANKLPFVYISANSGARLGLISEVKKHFKVAMSGDTFSYIYLEKADKEKLDTAGVKVNCEEVKAEDGSVHLKIVDIIGEDNAHIGVENLQGSALIAGEMSLNYATIPTISIASGRTVGIGAYLVRLGRRVVQAKGAPIILTGYMALNRLLGKDVYSDNAQLGGTDIMCPNGVTHWNVANDLGAVESTLQWLDFVPSVSDSKVSRQTLTLPIDDPVDRDVTFTPQCKMHYDPRKLVCGDESTTGMFDAGSWMECMADWAKTVVAGRATLGGIPCGVVLVETRTTKKFNPADPADPESVAAVNPQAGQVWFPDSARKTADAMEDFHKESLPCFIIANWRGFSGGMRDMYDQVLKFGASIVDNLRQYTYPVFIYIPPFGELRGGAWVVVDPVINHHAAVEMYCDATSRGGILEPAGVVEIKYREAEVRELIRRSDREVMALAATNPSEASKRETALVPLYNEVATHFADLHDTPGRMKAKGCIVDVVPWVNARRIFFKKLSRKMAEMDAIRTLVKEGGFASESDAKHALEGKFTGPRDETYDEAFTTFLLSGDCGTFIAKAVSDFQTATLKATLGSNAALLKKLLQDPELRKTVEEAL